MYQKMTVSNVTNPQTPLIEAVRQYLASQADHLLQQIAQIDSSDWKISSDAVHKTRTALRRCLSVLTAVRPWIDKEWSRSREKPIKRLLRALGPVRDLDIVLQHTQSAFNPASQEVIDVIDLIRMKRVKACQLFCRMMTRTDTKKQLLQDLSRLNQLETLLSMQPAPISEAGQVRLFTLGDCLPAMLFSSSATVTAYHQVISRSDIRQDQGDEHSMDALYHRLRVSLKDLRNLLLFASPVIPEKSLPFFNQIKSLQNDLGYWHDALIVHQYLGGSFSDKQKEVIHPLQMSTAARLDHLKASFSAHWESMTAEWFLLEISSYLTNVYRESVKTGCACSGCGGQPEKNDQA